MSDDINRILQLSGVKSKVKSYDILTERNTVNELATWTEKLPDGTLRTHTHDYSDQKPSGDTYYSYDEPLDTSGFKFKGSGTGSNGSGRGSGTTGAGTGSGTQGTSFGSGNTNNGRQGQGPGQGVGQSTGVPGPGGGRFYVPGSGYNGTTSSDDKDNNDSAVDTTPTTVINPPKISINNPYYDPRYDKTSPKYDPKVDEPKTTPTPPKPTPAQDLILKDPNADKPRTLPSTDKTEPKKEPLPTPGPSYKMVTPAPLPKEEPKPEPKKEPLPTPGPSYTMITPAPLPKEEPKPNVITPNPVPTKTVDVDTSPDKDKGSSEVAKVPVELPAVPFDPKKSLWTRRNPDGTVTQNWDADWPHAVIAHDITDHPRYSDPKSPDYIPNPQSKKTVGGISLSEPIISKPVVKTGEQPTPTQQTDKAAIPPPNKASAGSGSPGDSSSGTNGASGEKGTKSLADPWPRPTVQKPWETPKGKFDSPGMIGSPDLKGTMQNPGTMGPNPLMGVPELGPDGKDPSAITSPTGGPSVYSADEPGVRVIDVPGKKKNEDIDRMRTLAGLK